MAGDLFSHEAIVVTFGWFQAQANGRFAVALLGALLLYFGARVLDRWKL